MAETKSVKASSIRRALTTLKKAGFIQDVVTDAGSGEVRFTVYVPGELTMAKKRIRQSQTKKTKK